jgi:hypothetical protein
MKVVQEGEADFLIKNVSILKYGLHFSAVISRRDPLAGGAIEVQKNALASNNRQRCRLEGLL